MGNGALSSCQNACGIEQENEFTQQEYALRDAMQKAGPKMSIRIIGAPTEPSLGARMGLLQAGDELVIDKFEVMNNWTSMQRRFGGVQGNSRARAPGAPMPPHQSCGGATGVARQCLRAQVLKHSSNGGAAAGERFWMMFQVAIDPVHRTSPHVEKEVCDCRDVASYAHKFNLHMVRAVGGGNGHGEQVPGVTVAAPVAGVVLQSAVGQICDAGDHITLTPYDFSTVNKYVYDATEEFLEIPQAFYHFVFHSSGGREMVCDLQGDEHEDGSVTLVDPLVLRTPAPGVADLLRAVAPGNLMRPGPEGAGPTSEHFDAIHPKCSQMCKAFDPTRKSGHARRHCGLGGISCGVGGG